MRELPLNCTNEVDDQKGIAHRLLEKGDRIGRHVFAKVMRLGNFSRGLLLLDEFLRRPHGILSWVFPHPSVVRIERYPRRGPRARSRRG